MPFFIDAFKNISLHLYFLWRQREYVLGDKSKVTKVTLVAETKKIFTDYVRASFLLYWPAAANQLEENAKHLFVPKDKKEYKAFWKIQIYRQFLIRYRLVVGLVIPSK